MVRIGFQMLYLGANAELRVSNDAPFHPLSITPRPQSYFDRLSRRCRGK